MSVRPATVEHARPAPPRLPAARPPAAPAGRQLAPGLALAALFAAAAAYHALQSAFHLTPAIFTDELLHSKLAQSLAAGDGFSVRGEGLFFPAPLPALLQAPAWLAGDVGTGYALAKVLNALAMSAACFPAYFLARQLVRPSFALLAAAATVAAPALVYHSYLLSEALAYPVFLAALAVMVRALARPSHRAGLAVLAVSLLAVATRTQFLALPLAYLLVALALGRGAGLRKHALPAVALLGLAAVALATRGAVLGTYVGAALLEYEAAEVVRFGLLTGALLPFAAGWLVVPGAALGLAALLAGARAERAFALLALVLGAAFLLQAGLIASGDSDRPLERYAIYLAPLAFVAFFAYVERGAPRRRAYVVLALTLGVLAWLVPFPALADFRFSFGSPTLSAYGMLATWVGDANAATVFAAVPFAASVAVALAPLAHRSARALAVASLALLLLTGLAAYAADRGMTRRAVSAWAGSPHDWLDRSGLGRADYLGLPGASPHFAWILEAWNRDFGRPLWLGADAPFNDSFASSRAEVRADGILLVDGRPASAGLLVVGAHGSRIELEGSVVARPRPDLVVYRTPHAPRVRSLAAGLYFDGWAGQTLVYRAWPEHRPSPGVYRVELSLPQDLPPRSVELAVAGGPARAVELRSGASVALELPAPAGSDGRLPALRLASDRVTHLGGGTANPRLVSVRVERLEWVALPYPATASTRGSASPASSRRSHVSPASPLA